MKIRLSELSAGSCFLRGRKGKVEKKVEGDRIASRGKAGKVRTRPVRGDPEVQSVSCPLWAIGIGMRHNPSEIVEIGDGRPRIRGVRPLHDGR